MPLKGGKVNKGIDVVLYIRLSDEDEQKENNNESESITNQRKVLTDFAKERNFNIVNEYIDDGYTGLSFDRPGWNKLIDDIEKGSIQCILVKDFSRLGRENSKFLYYIQNYFPTHNVRIIAVNENYDSDVNFDEDIIPFKAVLNDLYSKDISRKVRSTLKSKMKNGEYVGSRPPYGYLKDPKNKNKLIVDPYASIIVKRIFSEFLNGKNMSMIAKNLTLDNIDVPSYYNSKAFDMKPKENIWKAQTIKYILTNEMYTGCLVQGKVENLSYKIGKQMRKSKNDWVKFKNAHEAIIDSNTYQQVQLLFQTKTHSIVNNSYLLTGLLRCKECGTSLCIYSSTKKPYINCKTYFLTHRMTCHSHSMNYYELEKLILDETKNALKTRIIDYDTINESLNLSTDKILKEIDEIKKQIQDLESKLKLIYEDRINQIISLEDYQNYCKEYKEKIENKNNEILALNEQLKDIQNDFTYDELVKSILELEQPDKLLMKKLIKKVVIDKNKEVEIYFNFC